MEKIGKNNFTGGREWDIVEVSKFVIGEKGISDDKNSITKMS